MSEMNGKYEEVLLLEKSSGKRASVFLPVEILAVHRGQWYISVTRVPLFNEWMSMHFAVFFYNLHSLIGFLTYFEVQNEDNTPMY